MHFDPVTDIPDLSGKVILITGGTDGIGRETSRALAQHGPSKVYLAARNRHKAEKTIADITSSLTDRSKQHPRMIVLEMDLSSLGSIRLAAQQFLAHENRLDILVCNAGVLLAKGLTTDGYEVVFGTNHMGHSLLITLLLSTLLSTAKRTGVQPGDTRCVILASSGESFAPSKYLFDSIRTDLSQKSLWQRYGQSKLANVHTARALAERYPESESGVRFLAVHPGNVETSMGEGLIPFKCVRLILGFVGRLFHVVVDPDEGAYNSLWAATGPSRDGDSNSDGDSDDKHSSDKVISESGEFYFPVAKRGKGSKRAYDMGMANQLWHWTENELKPWVEGVELHGKC